MTTEISIRRSEMEVFSATHGVCAIILNGRHEILVGREMKSREEHDRVSGQLSIPMESLKAFERRNQTAMMLAALSEVTTDANVARLSEGLREAGISGPVELNDHIQGAVAVFHWMKDPGEMPFAPSSPEFGQFQWMKPEEFLREENIRPFAVRTLDYAQQNGLMNGLLTKPITTLSSFHPERYNMARDIYPDVE